MKLHKIIHDIVEDIITSSRALKWFLFLLGFLLFVFAAKEGIDNYLNLW